MNAIILLGPPGAGKGTLAESLITQGYTHISTGDLLRDAIKNSTPLGRKAKSYIDKGELVPDELIIEIIKKRICGAQPEEKFLFDGFPRTLVQARELDRLLLEENGKITNVIKMECPEEVIVRRLSGRRICRTCGAVYHVKYKPPRIPGICDVDGGELYQRDDDNETTLRNRLKIYIEQTEPVLTYYEKKDLLCPINAGGPIQQSINQALQCLNK